MDNFNLKNFINENNLGAYSKLEGQKRDVDGDGDIDSDDYMAAKDAAIKKATGKNEDINEVSPDIMDSLDSIIMGGLAALGAVKLAPKLIDLLGDPETGEITHDSLKRAKDKLMKEDASAEEEETFHKKLDTLVHKTFGKRPEEMKNEDLDVGHQDDEPNMLKKTMYRTAKMAAMIYKELDKFDQFPNEVDFPNWWQAKLIKANDYLNSAFDYLDGEQQTAKLDAMGEEVEEMKHPQYGTASNKYASRANKPGKFGNSPELNKTLGDTAQRAMDILKRKGLAEDNIKLSDAL